MIYMHVVVPHFLNINGALTCKTQLRQCQLVLLVCPAKSNWWCSRLYGLLNKQICHFAKLLRCTIAFLNRIWIWSALDLLINQDVSTKDISAFKQTGRESVVQGKREKRTLPSHHKSMAKVCTMLVTDAVIFSDRFSLIFSFPPLSLLPSFWERCQCYMAYEEVSSSQEKWFCKNTSGNP